MREPDRDPLGKGCSASLPPEVRVLHASANHLAGRADPTLRARASPPPRARSCRSPAHRRKLRTGVSSFYGNASGELWKWFASPRCCDSRRRCRNRRVGVRACHQPSRAPASASPRLFSTSACPNQTPVWSSWGSRDGVARHVPLGAGEAARRRVSDRKGLRPRSSDLPG